MKQKQRTQKQTRHPYQLINLFAKLRVVLNGLHYNYKTKILKRRTEGTPISHNKHSSALKILLDSLKASICIIYLVHMPPTTKNKLQFSTLIVSQVPSVTLIIELSYLHLSSSSMSWLTGAFELSLCWGEMSFKQPKAMCLDCVMSTVYCQG